MSLSGKTKWTVVLAVIALGGCSLIVDEAPKRETPATALARLQQATGGRIETRAHPATGAARFLSLPESAADAIGQRPARSAAAKERASAAFFRAHGAAVGVDDPASLKLERAQTDRLGETHLTYHQYYAGLRVFGTSIRTHFDAAHRLKAVNGTALPGLDLDPTPSWSSALASIAAIAAVEEARGTAQSLRAPTSTLLVFHEGLAQGVPGVTHLAWEIEVTDGVAILDRVYVSAHTGKVIDRISAVHDALYRRAYDGHQQPAPPSNYPNGAFWTEGRSFPTSKDEANELLLGSEETYRFFSTVFDFDSFDGSGARMDMIFNRGYSCPNASWNGTFISFCPGFGADDVTAHEWGHAYTQYTHGLIYQWQPGALNEAYSDIWGETIDRWNSRGANDPGPQRTEGECSSFSPPVTRLRVHTAGPAEGPHLAQAASFGAPLDTTGIDSEIVAAIDAGESSSGQNLDGCSEILNAADVSGKIALVNRGTCEFGLKALNAERAGARAVVVADNQPGLIRMGPGAVGSQVTIPVVSVMRESGNRLREALGLGPVLAILLAEPGTDVSNRWLMGEDVTNAEAPGALRDMWNPTCYSNPGKVSDPFYWCAADDQGGVHINSGIPNKAYALLVDGGSANGQTVRALGLTRAASIYWRAQAHYQVFDTDFADHAGLLRTSCSDLVGAALTGLDGNPTSEVITADDCVQVDNAIAAVELERRPSCTFTPNLATGNPATCQIQMTTGTTTGIKAFTFDTGDEGFAFSRSTSSSTFTPRDWVRRAYTTATTGRTGTGWFGETPGGGTCAEEDESGVLSLTSAEIAIPSSASFARATFDHWVGLEPGWDGGNLRVSVNGGAFELLPPSEFAFNGYHSQLFTAAQGNTNPLAGQPAWTGTTGGSVTAGSWGRSLVNLGNLARPGDAVRLRWDLGTDGCAGRDGWYLDTVQVFSCVPRVPELRVADVRQAEGNGHSEPTPFTFTIRMVPQPITGAPPNTPTGTIVPVTVKWELVAGSAVPGEDYERIAGGGTLVIPASTSTTLFTSGTVTLNIKGDEEAEPDEQFTLRITEVTNATMADREATATIVNDDEPPASGAVTP